MKNVILTLAFLIQTVFVFATDKYQGKKQAVARFEQVKVYKQAGTCTEVVAALSISDKVTVIRQHNSNWTIITINDKVGYVLTSELTQPQVELPSQSRDIALINWGKR